MIKPWLIFFTLVLGIGECVRADNAVPIAEHQSGSRILTLFAHPAPLRAGPVDVALMMTDRGSGRPLLDWSATAVLRPLALASEQPSWVPPCCRMAVGSDKAVPFTSARSANAFLRNASLVIATPGTWALDLEVKLAKGKTIREPFEITIGNPPAPLSRYWLWIAALPLGIIGYVLTQKPAK